MAENEIKRFWPLKVVAVLSLTPHTAYTWTTFFGGKIGDAQEARLLYRSARHPDPAHSKQEGWVVERLSLPALLVVESGVAGSGFAGPGAGAWMPSWVELVGEE